MSRPIQVGDLVQISLGTQGDRYHITKINGVYIYIQTPDGEALIYPKDNEWKIHGGEASPYKITFLGKPKERLEVDQFLTGDPFQDQIILSQLDDESLTSMCSTNTYARQICQPILREKIMERYGEDIVNSIPEGMDMSQALYDLQHSMDHLDNRKFARIYGFDKFAEVEQKIKDELAKLPPSKKETDKWRIEDQIRKEESINLFSDNYDRAIRDGKSHVLKHIYDETGLLPEKEHLNMAIGYEEVPIVKWMVKLGLELPDPISQSGETIFNPISLPFENGYIDLVEYLLQVNPKYLYSIECHAAAGGHIQIMIWLAENGHQIFNVADCATNPHANLRYTYGFYTPDFNTRLNRDLYLRNLQVVQWLHQNYGHLPSLKSVKSGLVNGNVYVANYVEPFGVLVRDKTTGRSAASRALTRYIDAEKKAGPYSSVDEIRSEALQMLKWLAQRGFTPKQTGSRLQVYHQIIT